MSLTFAQRGPRPPLNMTQIQKMLDENGHLINTIQECQSKGKAQESIQYQQVLHRNLVYLASIADSSQQLMSSLLPPPNISNDSQQQPMTQMNYGHPPQPQQTGGYRQPLQHMPQRPAGPQQPYPPQRGYPQSGGQYPGQYPQGQYNSQNYANQQPPVGGYPHPPNAQGNYGSATGGAYNQQPSQYNAAPQPQQPGSAPTGGPNSGPYAPSIGSPNYSPQYGAPQGYAPPTQGPYPPPQQGQPPLSQQQSQYVPPQGSQALPPSGYGPPPQQGPQPPPGAGTMLHWWNGS